MMRDSMQIFIFYFGNKYSLYNFIFTLWFNKIISKKKLIHLLTQTRTIGLVFKIKVK